MKRLKDRHEQLEYLLNEDKGMFNSEELLKILVKAMSNQEFKDLFDFIIPTYEVRKPFKVSFIGRMKDAIGVTGPIKYIMYEQNESLIEERLYENYEHISKLIIEELPLT